MPDRPAPRQHRQPPRAEQRPDRADQARRPACRGHRPQRQRRTARSRPGAFPQSTIALEQLDPGARDRASVRGRPDRLVRGLHPPRRRSTPTAAPAASRRWSARLDLGGVLDLAAAILSQAPALTSSSACGNGSAEPASRARPPARATAARARWSAAASTTPRRAIPCNPEPGADRAMKRILAAARSLLLAAGVSGDRRRRVQRQRGRHLQDRARQRLRPRHRVPTSRSPACRAGTIKSIDLDHRRHARADARARHRRRDPGRLRPVPLRRVLPIAPAVADRRVLHRLPARAVRARCSSRAARSRSPARSRRSRPTCSRTSCGCPTGSASR